MLSWLFRIFDSMRADDEDAARALRIQREYSVPSEAVEPPRGRRRFGNKYRNRAFDPAQTSIYTQEPRR